MTGLAIFATTSQPTSVLVWGGTLGAVLSGLGLFLPLWIHKRRRELLNDRPPQQSKLLRPPGYSLYQRLEALNDRSGTLLARLVGCGSVFGLGAGAFVADIVANGGSGVALFSLISAHPWFAMLTAISGLVATQAIFALLKLFRELRATRLGLRGEQAVAEVLSSPAVVESGYTSFHDVPGDGPWNIDHVVVGPAGVFVIETKTRSKRKSLNGQKEHEVFFDGRTLQFPWCFDGQATQQVLRNTEWVTELLKDFGPPNILVQPIIVIPGWWVETKGKFPVLAMNANYLKQFLSSQPKRFAEPELKMALRRLDERCRTVEF